MENQHEIGQILNEVQTISDSYERVAEVTGENFNIFSILQMESDEVARAYLKTPTCHNGG